MQFDNMKNNQIETKSFLRKVAEDVCKMPKEQLTDLILIFTNRRAIKYFEKEYKSMQEGVFMMPECKTINDFVTSLSPYKQADELSLVYLLYKSYSSIYYSKNPLSENEEAESFENFFFWGKTILNDFDDIDKNLADARKLYTTLSEEKEIDELFDFLDEKQKIVLLQYFNDFKKLYSGESKLKDNFVKIWNCLFDIYSDFKKRLSENSIAYSGMIYRELVERESNNEVLFGENVYAIIGFNVLNQSETLLFQQIRESNSTFFYWDYDTYYTEDKRQEAGLFMRENITKFPCSETYKENDFSQIKNNDSEINIIKTSYETSQVLYIRKWIKDLEERYGDSLRQNQIAIILLNENLLPYVVKALPNTINNQATQVNITMGYPFKFSNLYEEISIFLDKPENKSLSATEQIDKLIEFLKNKGKGETCSNEVKESVFRSIEKLTDFKQTIDFIKEELPETFIRKTILRLLQKQSMPFESDSINGIQIMGLLESRNLDFSHVLLLSATSTQLPGSVNSITFISNSLRRAFGLTTDDRKLAVYAYYFYRLLHNIKTIDIIYNSISANKDNEELSCFLQQLRLESSKQVSMQTLSFGTPKNEIQITIPAKEKSTIEDIISGKCNMENEKSFFSPSFLNSYLSCPLQFYYDKIKELKPSDEEADLQYLAFGSLFHNSAELFEKSNREKSYEDCIEEGLKEIDDKQKAIIKSFHKELVRNYLFGLAEYDKQNQERKFQNAEVKIYNAITIDGIKVKFGGIIDRIDLEGETLVLSDYKTGGDEESFKYIEDLFDSKKENRAKYLFQIFFYAWLLWEKAEIDIGEKKLRFNKNKIKVQIIYVHKLRSPQYKVKTYEYNAEIHKDFDECMKKLVKSLFDTDSTNVWEPQPKENICKYCDYQTLCPNNEIENEDDTI